LDNARDQPQPLPPAECPRRSRALAPRALARGRTAKVLLNIYAHFNQFLIKFNEKLKQIIIKF
jgi:hypothetical protein